MSTEALPPRSTAEDSASRTQRRVAVAIMAVTLIGAVFAFLQTYATNRAARSSREADARTAEATGELAGAAARVTADWETWLLAMEEAMLTGALGVSDPAVADSHGAAQDALSTFSELSRPPYSRDDGVDWLGFVHENFRGAYVAGEYQAAYSEMRDGWGDKAGNYVAVVTILAVALFLIGLSRTPVGATSGAVLVGSGLALAAAGAVWGIVVLARPVPLPSGAAIEAYVDGMVAFNSAYEVADLQEAEDAFTQAIITRPDFVDAYFGRGLARLQEDFFKPGGPTGSVGARDDYARVTALQPLNAIAWNNLAAANFWLDDLDGALAAIRRSLALDPDRLLPNLNLALFLAVVGDTAGYNAQLETARALLAAGEVPASELDFVVLQTGLVLDLAEAYRPDVAPVVPQLRADLGEVFGTDL